MSETTLQKLIYKTRAKGMQGEAEKAQAELDRLAKLEDGIRARARVCEWRGEELTAESLRALLGEDGE